MRTHVCLVCGADFKPKRTDRTTACSRACGLVWSSRKSALRKTGGRVAVSVVIARCSECGRSYVKQRGARTCSDACRAERNRRASRRSAQTKDNRDRSARPCKECGNEFVPAYGNKRRMYCSSACLKRRYARVRRSKERARMRGAAVEVVDPLKVFDRDRWRCQLCGVSTPRRLRGTCEPNAPELDHILPLSKGGAHSYRNTQCACRSCNHEKADGKGGQLRLFGGVPS